MEDVLTEVPPPSRFFQEDLNNFIPPSPPLPSPFFLFSEPYTNKPLKPSLLIVALSAPSLHIFHNVSSKKLIGTIILPEIPFSGNSITPSLKDKSCNIYSLDDAENTVLVTIQCPVPAERAYALSKLLLCGQLVAERVLILDSIKVLHFRGKLSRDEAIAYKLDTSSERNGDSSLIKDLEYFPSGSMIDGLGAALLGRCQTNKIRGSLCVSWPEYENPVTSLIISILQKNVLPTVEFTVSGSVAKDPLLDSDLYT